MKWNDMLENWGLQSIKLNAGFAEVEFQPNPDDEIASWEMYVELITRITTQVLPDEDGDEQTALNSVYALFGITRDILKRHGRKCKEFTKISIVVLNQIIRPFTAKWHKLSMTGAFEEKEDCQVFRNELRELQMSLRKYTRLLADIARVEDLTNLSD